MVQYNSNTLRSNYSRSKSDNFVISSILRSRPPTSPQPLKQSPATKPHLSSCWSPQLWRNPNRSHPKCNTLECSNEWPSSNMRRRWLQQSRQLVLLQVQVWEILLPRVPRKVLVTSQACLRKIPHRASPQHPLLWPKRRQLLQGRCHQPPNSGSPKYLHRGPESWWGRWKHRLLGPPSPVAIRRVQKSLLCLWHSTLSQNPHNSRRKIARGNLARRHQEGYFHGLGGMD